VRYYGAQHNPRIREGEDGQKVREYRPKGLIKITERQAEILRLREEGLTLSQIAARFDVTKDTISAHLNKVYETRASERGLALAGVRR
jgi:DNA-binding NarL/FixJ family response regulator